MYIKDCLDSKMSNVLTSFILLCVEFVQYSVDDEYVIQTALTLNSSTCGLVFFDARSAIAASGNQLKVRK